MLKDLINKNIEIKINTTSMFIQSQCFFGGKGKKTAKEALLAFPRARHPTSEAPTAA